MKSSIKKKWLSALESGLYDQVTGKLGAYVDGGKDMYCCLGVLCDVLLDDDKAPITLNERYDHDEDTDIVFSYESSLLPTDVVDYLGFDSADPDFGFDLDPDLDYYGSDWEYREPFDDRGTVVELSLSGLNDSGFTFGQIADVIRWAVPDE